ncbi:protein of unknown function DUF323 [Nitrosococcus halophilus Nc 4]|uniref:Uncharacterized protein n=1 Tax=Nitrosococcus halophilus (strain Nc4) TaxID=472759 RepID=D5C178_NITHN|nr:SUMF1/EgtB/PvdO family nonheme iron enzyme [Nitrosococcus halophilus]ADE14635.1 protein of unknown function DUF323 [Nitrosococcus halophilus Nc 4]
MMVYSGKQKIAFSKRLQRDWKDLADYFDIPPQEQAAFDKGHEPRDIWVWLEERERLQELPEALHYIDREDIIAEVLTPPTPPPPPATHTHQKGSPFPGLRAFTTKEARLFFGRTAETNELLNKIKQQALVAVIGASGSGKSSLVAAGGLPRLRELPGGESWQKIRFTPGGLGDDPFLPLAAKLEPYLETHDLSGRTIAEKLRATGDLAALVRPLFEERPATTKLLFFIDQFEELFTLTEPKHHKRFIAMLEKAAQADRLRLVLALRADFFHHCIDYPRFDKWLRAGFFSLAPPDLLALMEMITGPAAVAGLSFEEGLSGRILRDTGNEPGALALMAFALAELYKACQPGTTLTHTAYDSFGGIKGAIGKRAEDAYAKLNKDAQNALAGIFKELVEIDSERGIPTRRRSSLTHFKTTPAACTSIEQFAKARLLNCGDPEEDRDVVEVAHESLLTRWPRLKKWIEDRFADFWRRKQLQQAALEWEVQERKEAYRWSHERVVEACGMLKRLDYQPTPLEQEFLGPIHPQHMLAEIQDPDTSHECRALIGVRLALLGDPDPRKGVGLREDGLPDIEWRQVPPGEVILEVEGDEPAFPFPVAPFYIARYPVTWQQYQAFLEAADGYSNPERWQGLLDQHSAPGRPFQAYDNHPADNVSWLDAVAFCRWLSARLGYEIRLPTQWEWQQAATGGDPANMYPWGVEENPAYANTYESGLSRSTAVGMYPLGASPVGALDMGGNLWEWCLNEYRHPERTQLSGDESRVVRGGSWGNDLGLARSAFRYHYLPNNRFILIGFRVVCSSPI